MVYSVVTFRDLDGAYAKSEIGTHRFPTGLELNYQEHWRIFPDCSTITVEIYVYTSVKRHTRSCFECLFPPTDQAAT